MSAEIGKIKEGSYSEKKSYNVTQHPKEKENAGKEKELQDQTLILKGYNLAGQRNRTTLVMHVLQALQVH